MFAEELITSQKSFLRLGASRKFSRQYIIRSAAVWRNEERPQN